MTIDPDIQMFLDEVYTLSAAGEDRRALNLIYAVLDDFLLDGKFDVCDLYLEQVDLSRLDTASMLGFLTITRPDRARLRMWDTLYERILAEYRARQMPEDKVERILSGFQERINLLWEDGNR